MPIQNNPLIIPCVAFFYLLVCVDIDLFFAASGGAALPCFMALMGYVCCLVCVWWGK